LDRLSWLQVFSPATLKLYWRLLREGKQREEYGKDDIYQSGGDFLIDRDGNLLFAHAAGTQPPGGGETTDFRSKVKIGKR
jgi:hypothetical protein